MTAIMYIRQNSFGLRNDAHCCGLLVMQDSVCISMRCKGRPPKTRIYFAFWKHRPRHHCPRPVFLFLHIFCPVETAGITNRRLYMSLAFTWIGEGLVGYIIYK